jgi:predicted CopG family antitoxin
MKTITIRDEVYEALARLKREHESFSDVIERLLERRPSLEEFFGCLRDSELLDNLESVVLELRRSAKTRL